jgi:hypothetical protein
MAVAARSRAVVSDTSRVSHDGALSAPRAALGIIG